MCCTCILPAQLCGSHEAAAWQCLGSDVQCTPGPDIQPAHPPAKGAVQAAEFRPTRVSKAWGGKGTEDKPVTPWRYIMAWELGDAAAEQVHAPRCWWTQDLRC